MDGDPTTGAARGRRRPSLVLALLAVVMIAVALAAVLVVGRPEATVPAASPAPSSVPLSPDRAATVDVSDRWRVDVPVGGVREESQLTVEIVDDLADVGAETLGAAALTLSSGQPAAPWTLTHRLDEPLPPDEFLILVNDPESAGPSVFRAGADLDAYVSDTTLVPAQLSPDRRTATFEVAHLSLLQIIRGSWDDVQRFGENAVEFGGAVGATLADGAAGANHALAGTGGQPLRLQP